MNRQSREKKARSHLIDKFIAWVGRDWDLENLYGDQPNQQFYQAIEITSKWSYSVGLKVSYYFLFVYWLSRA